ncbi:LysR family transcriptional regulator [Empedobacter falsenii]|nr:LysR family transcriptional regulator [Empedobacter falsenii]
MYETGTLSAAAQQLFISQPGVILHLNSLEAYTGYKLFDRSARKMVPTEKGKILYNFILEPIQKLAAAEQHFWKENFKEHPDFKPNYIVPNISSIIRCLSDGNGFSIVPDFLCQEALNSGKIKLVWQGEKPLENTLYFGSRKNTIYEKEIEQLQQIFVDKWCKDLG